MAQYFPYIQETIPDQPVVYTPDFNFFNSILQKKDLQYEQGVSKIASAYSKLKADVTDPVNMQKRDQFLKDADSELRRLASSDLSLIENVNAGNNIFGPLASNPAFNYDAFKTKEIKEQNQILNDWANAPDEETRKKYNPRLQRWLNRDLEVLREGKGDINNYKKIQNRKALAYIDPQDILAQAAKDHGFQFKIDTAGNPYIVSVEGGKEGIPSYNAFAEAILGNNQAYQRQVKALGEADSEDVLDLYKNKPEWQGKTDYEKFIDYGISSRDEHRKTNKKYLDDIEKNFNKEDADIRAYYNANQQVLNQGQSDIASGNNGTKEAQTWMDFLKRTSNRNSLKNKLQEEKSIFDENYGSNAPDDLTFATNLAKNPKSFFSTQQFKNDIQTFANIKASSVSRKITADSAYVSLETAKLTAMKNTWNMIDDMQDNYTDQEKLALKEMQLNLKGQKTKVNADGTTTIVGTDGAEIIPGSASATQLYTLNVLNTLKEQLNLTKGKALESMIGPTGALSILSSFGMSNEDVGKLKTLFSKQFTADDPSKAIGLTADDKKIIQNFVTKAVAFNKNAGGTFDASEYTQYTVKDIPFILQKALAGYTSKNENDIAAKRGIEEYNHFTEELAIKASELEKGKKAVASVFSDAKAHPEFKGMFTTKNGLPALIDESDIEKAFNGFTNITAAQKKQIVSDYINGTLRYDIKAHVSGGTGGAAVPGQYDWLIGKKPKQGDARVPVTETITLSDGTQITNYTSSIGEKTFFSEIPNPDKYKELIKRINTEIPIGDWTDKQGMMLSNPRFLLKGKTAAKMALELSDPTQSSANIFEYSEGTAEEKQVEGDQTAIRNAMKDEKNIAGVTVYTASPLNKGGLAVAVTMTSTNRDDSKKQSWEGRTFYYPISINQTSPEILRIFGKVNDAGEYERYRREGKDFVIDTFQGEGIKAIIHPNMGDDNRGTIEVLHKPWNPTTKTYGDWEPVDPMLPSVTFSLDNSTFPEIKDKLYQEIIYPHVRQFIVRQKEAAKAAAANKPITLDSLLN